MSGCVRAESVPASSQGASPEAGMVGARSSTFGWSPAVQPAIQMCSCRYALVRPQVCPTRSRSKPPVAQSDRGDPPEPGASSSATPSSLDASCGAALLLAARGDPDLQQQQELRAWRPTGERSCCARSKVAIVGAAGRLYRLVARVTSHGPILKIKKFLSSALFAVDPLLKGKAMHHFLKTGDPCWAACAFLCYLMPILLMYAGTNGWLTQARGLSCREVFTRTFCSAPTMMKIVQTHYSMMGLTLTDAVKCTLTATPQQQCYMQNVFSLCEQTTFTALMVYVFFRQAFVKETQVIKFTSVGPGVIPSLLNAVLAFDYVATYSGLQCGGNVREFLNILLSLGHGAAPPGCVLRIFQGFYYLSPRPEAPGVASPRHPRPGRRDGGGGCAERRRAL